MTRWTKRNGGRFAAGDVSERFWESIALWDDCWIWTGKLNDDGYGRFFYGGRYHPAHHFLLPNPPVALHADHLCRNHACVKPSHIEIVTNKENVLRGEGVCAVNAAKTHCPKGHLYDYINSRGRRCCRRCIRSRAAAVGSTS